MYKRRARRGDRIAISFTLIQMDTNSSLIGLYPSEYALQECSKQEKQLPLKVMKMKNSVEDPIALKAEVKDILVHEIGWMEKIIKGDIVIIRKYSKFYYARYTGEHNNGMPYSQTFATSRFHCLPSSLFFHFTPSCARN